MSDWGIPTGYAPADAGILLCPNCANVHAVRTGASLDDVDAYGAVFQFSETDTLQTCDDCGEIIETDVLGSVAGLESFDSFDLAEGLYWYAAEYHGGQSSRLYGILSELGAIYRPSVLAKSDTMSETARQVYDLLVDGSADAAQILTALQS